MWPFKQKTRQRRLDVRKGLPSGAASKWARFREAGGIGSLLLAGVFFLALVLMDVLPAEPVGYRVGQYVPQDIRARVQFRVPSQELKEELLRKAENTTPPMFRLDTALLDEIQAALDNLPDQLKATTQPTDLEQAFAEQFALSGEQLAAVREYLGASARREQFKQRIQALRSELGSTYIVRNEALQRYTPGTEYGVFLGPQQSHTRRTTGELTTLTQEGRIARMVERLAREFDPAMRPHVQAYLRKVVEAGRPLYVYDEARSLDAIAEAKTAIETNPPDEAYRTYAVGQPLARASRRQTAEGQVVEGLSQAELALLAEEATAFRRARRQGEPWRYWFEPAGRAGIALLLTVALSAYVGFYQRRVVEDHVRGAVLIIVLLAMLGLAKIVAYVPTLNPCAALCPVLLGTIILCLAYDQRFALAIGSALALLAVLQMRSDFTMLLVMLTGAGAVALQLSDVRTRSRLIELTAIVGAIVFLAVGAAGLATAIPWRFILIDGLWAGGMAMLAGLVVQGFLPAIERAFHIATSMTLLEWCDASRPLLKRLATEAPGTYNHSLQLGAMCESAAEAIGARGLLARVGAYYHDIGKINKPAYFVENQAGSPSKHDRLSPAMSLLIIIGHVKDGLEMARQCGLPAVLHQFIATHHGTTLVQYFYHAAAEKSRSEDQRAPDEVEFRYPGPKPQTREAAILMLADAAESSVRSMSEPTPGRIENQVHTMVSRRLMDGQLDECDMTLREVHLVEASLVKSLCGIYHGRIAYPTPAGQKPSAGELQAERRQQEQAASAEKTAE